MLHIVLYQPEIPPNTGNIIRLAANTGAQLHLIKPLGFILDDKRLRRAGLDYHEWARVKLHESFEDFLAHGGTKRCFALSTKGAKPYHTVRYEEGDALIMGPETRGLPEEVRMHPRVEACIKLPMADGSRSLNLSNATAIVLYEAWRQLGFTGASD